MKPNPKYWYLKLILKRNPDESRQIKNPKSRMQTNPEFR